MKQLVDNSLYPIEEEEEGYFLRKSDHKDGIMKGISFNALTKNLPGEMGDKVAFEYKGNEPSTSPDNEINEPDEEEDEPIVINTSDFKNLQSVGSLQQAPSPQAEEHMDSPTVQ